MDRYLTWPHYGLTKAEELGVTVANADEQSRSSQMPAVQRLLGTTGELGSRLGLDNRWMLAAITSGGNYRELFERTVGSANPLKPSRGLNALWSKGGLMYAIPSHKLAHKLALMVASPFARVRARYPG